MKRPDGRATGTERVDIWLADPDTIDESMLGIYLRLLSPVEVEQADRYRVRQARLQFLVARVWLRRMLSSYVDVGSHEWTFEADRFGKPYVAGPLRGRHLAFNVSHTTGLVACAVTTGRSVGIDVEDERRNVDALIEAPGVLTDRELDRIRAMPLALRKRHFCSLWTLKEAYAKAIGLGLSAPFNAFGFSLDDAGANVRFAAGWKDSATSWQFHRIAPTGQHQLAVAIQAHDGRATAVRISWPQLGVNADKQSRRAVRNAEIETRAGGAVVC